MLPEWNLADLYAGTDDPQVKGDLDRAAAESLAFEETYKGKLAALAKQADAGSAMAAAVKRYEALDAIFSAGSRPMPASYTPGTPSIPLARNS